MEDFEKRCCLVTTGAPPNFVPAMHRSRTARSALRGLFATNPRVCRLGHQCNIRSFHSQSTDITPTSAFSTKVAHLSLITMNRCDLGAVAILRFRRTMSSTLWVLGSKGSSPMEDVEKRCCPATTGAPLHYRPAMHRSRTARSPLHGLLAANPRGWRLEHHVIYSCSHPRRPILHRPQVFRPKLFHYR